MEGKIKTRSWEDKDTGKKVYRTEIIVGAISLLSNSEGNGRQSSGDNRRSSQSKAGNRDNADEFGDLGITDADVPF